MSRMLTSHPISKPVPPIPVTANSRRYPAEILPVPNRNRVNLKGTGESTTERTSPITRDIWPGIPNGARLHGTQTGFYLSGEPTIRPCEKCRRFRMVCQLDRPQFSPQPPAHLDGEKDAGARSTARSSWNLTLPTPARGPMDFSLNLSLSQLAKGDQRRSGGGNPRYLRISKNVSFP